MAWRVGIVLEKRGELTMKVSIVIPTYNCSEYLSEAIDSVLKQTYRNLEIIVIDDGSIDNTRDILNQYQQDYPDRIRSIYQENLGVAVARNNGIKNAQGEVIALLDADDIWVPEMLECMVKSIKLDSSIGLVHANMTRMSEDGVPFDTPVRKTQYLTGFIFEHIFLRKAHIFGNAVLFRRECCEQVGLYDENLSKLGCEDRDLWLRIAKQYKVQHVDKTLAYYRIRKRSLSHNRKNMIRGRLYVVDKFCPVGGRNQKLRRLALTKIYKDLGDEFLVERNFHDATKQYLKAILSWPFSIWPIICLMKTTLKKLEEWRAKSRARVEDHVYTFYKKE